MKNSIFKKALSIILISLFNYQAIAQVNGQREVVIIDLYDPVNTPLFRPGIELPTLLVEGAKNNQIQLFYIEQGSGQPRNLTYQEYLTSMEIPQDFLEEMTWDANFSYLMDEMVEYNGLIYYSIINDNLGFQPDEHAEYWEQQLEVEHYSTADLSLLKVDRQFVGNRYHYQYLNFYLTADISPDGSDQYIFSVQANEAMALLNRSGFLWYSRYKTTNPETRQLGVLGNLAGDVFLRDSNTRGLASMLDWRQDLFDETINPLYVAESTEDTQIPIYYTYKNTHLDSIFIYQPYTNNVGQDSIAYEQVKMYANTTTGLFTMGDALVSKLHPVKTVTTSAASFESPTQEPKPGKPVKLAQVYIRERLNFQVSTNINYRNVLVAMMSDIARAVRTGKLPLYEDGYTAIDDADTVTQTPDKAFAIDYSEDYGLYDDVGYLSYEENWQYHSGDVVEFAGELYISQQDSNRHNIPGEDPEFWLQFTDHEIYPPSVVQILDVKYKLVFTDKGKIKDKLPVQIRFVIPGSLTISGYSLSLGSVAYQELVDYQSAHNITRWDPLLKVIEDQQAFKFRMIEYGNVRVADNK